MQTRILGNSRLKVSLMGLGCWGMSHAYGRADDRDSLRTLNLCLDRGINFWDTADVYGEGHNERLLARVLASRRQEVVLGTKFGFRGDEHGQVRVDGRPAHVRAACEGSLKRLGIDTIDLYYLHRLDPDVPVEETVGAMAELVAQGKVRCIGLSEVSAGTIRRAHRVHPITAVQSEYSLWHRGVEAEILPLCRELDISLVAFSPLGRGFLTGTIGNPDDLAPEVYRRAMPRFEARALERNQAAAALVKKIAGTLGATPAQVALAWLLQQSVLPIPGMKQEGYIDENLGALDLTLPKEAVEALGQVASLVSGSRHNPHNLQFIDS